VPPSGAVSTMLLGCLYRVCPCLQPEKLIR